MPLDLDRYYTPESIARRALEHACLREPPLVCADSTCGTGRLLEAANDVFGKVRCVGIDRDSDVIANLRRRNPNWLLAVGDLLNATNYRTAFAEIIPEHVDLLVLNPPFSLGNRKSVEVEYEGRMFKGSIAMAHLLRSFDLFKPKQGAVVVVPESLLYSETDSAARSALAEKYCMRKIADLKSCTFRGARAHASVVQVSASEQEVVPKTSAVSGKTVRVSVTRGGLPVHLMKPVQRGIPYMHSTDIRKVVDGSMASSLLQTAGIARGRIAGWVILIPRVGMPEEAFLRAVNFEDPVQLSDCVIALECSSKAVALQVEQRIKASWNDFREIYRGTGARYVTLSRLITWLARKNICEFG
jgi:hypothetical protein